MNEHAKLELDADRAERHRVIGLVVVALLSWAVIGGVLWLAVRWWW